ncbi:Transcription-silencing protein Clr2 [Lasallia pustulata]|uniref:Transcription-silencing protein Clr2 n=1 Tax=Lasallia pustulata TaxID=136370 RepID=A0A1W5CU32_9LECA|nr:Transcription-silencing protein Clr2 [Lasallia pustulata]
MVLIKVLINGYSDGDVSHRPPPSGNFRRVPSRLYREKLAKEWMEASGQAEPGKKYIFNRLSAGYELFSKPRPLTSVKKDDKYLYGHPSHHAFDSAKRFYPHFVHLMEHPNTGACPSNKAQAQNPAPANKYTAIFRQLRENGTIELNLKEVESSLDCRAERRVMNAMLDNIPKQSSFIPRVGEVVLWCREFEGEIAINAQTSESRVRDNTSGRDLGHPKWLAGIITQVPAEEVSLEDLLREITKPDAESVSRFRVECFPASNGSAEESSKQYSYVPMHQICPMCFWKEALVGIPNREWHPSIRPALKVTATMSAVEPYGATGTWPNCNIHCEGIFVGFEALFLGDAVRFTTVDTTVWGVMVLRDLQVQFKELTLAEDGEVDPTSARTYYIVLLGEVYTLDPQRSYKGMEVNLNEVPGSLPSGMRGYNKWYHMCEPGTMVTISYDWVVGRCFEAEAMRCWFTTSTADLNTGVSSVQTARIYSAQNDERIDNRRGHKWYWGSYRTDSLDIEESEIFDGFEVREYNPDGDPEMLGSIVRVINGVVMRGSRKTVAGKGPRKTVGMKGPWKGVREPDETLPQDDKAGKGTGEESGPDARREDEVTEDEVTEDELMEDELREDDTDSAEDEVNAVDDGVIIGMP